MANTSNASTLTTDFNVTPYYDDYDPTKNFYRILFKPGYAVQARELTQSQTILQKQIDRLGKHIFKEGSIVIPGAFTLETNYGAIKGPAIPYVKVKDYDVSNNEVTISDFYRTSLTGLTSNITSYVVEVAEGNEGDANTKTIFVRYTSTSNSNSAIKVYQPGETGPSSRQCGRRKNPRYPSRLDDSPAVKRGRTAIGGSNARINPRFRGFGTY
jgi:hypothetical protein